MNTARLFPSSNIVYHYNCQRIILYCIFHVIEEYDFLSIDIFSVIKTYIIFYIIYYIYFIYFIYVPSNM